MTTDSEIVRRSLADPAGFGELFDRHAGVLHRYLARRTDPAVADDLVAQTFLVAFERRSSYALERELALPWLYGIATNLLRRHRRDEVRMMRALQRSAQEPLPSEHGPGDRADDRADDRIDADRAVAGLASALRTMPRAQRDALLLHAWAELSYEQIAEATGVPIGTVRSRLSRARAALRAATPDPRPETEHHPAPTWRT